MNTMAIRAAALAFVMTLTGTASVLARPHSAPSDAPGVPDIQDRNDCVKQCDLDTLPCDPPIYKKADGRCSLKS